MPLKHLYSSVEFANDCIDYINLKHIYNDFQERRPIGVNTVSMEKES